MKTETRRERMKALLELCREYDRRGDVVLRSRKADEWALLATDSEMKRAPKVLTWSGRKA